MFKEIDENYNDYMGGVPTTLDIKYVKRMNRYAEHTYILLVEGIGTYVSKKVSKCGEYRWISANTIITLQTNSYLLYIVNVWLFIEYAIINLPIIIITSINMEELNDLNVYLPIAIQNGQGYLKILVGF